MTIFTVLKYSNINLSDRYELIKLPAALIENYWNNANALNPDANDNRQNDLSRKCLALARWHGDDTTDSERSLARRVFIQTLEEYQE